MSLSILTAQSITTVVTVSPSGLIAYRKTYRRVDRLRCWMSTILSFSFAGSQSLVVTDGKQIDVFVTRARKLSESSSISLSHIVGSSAHTEKFGAEFCIKCTFTPCLENILNMTLMWSSTNK